MTEKEYRAHPAISRSELWKIRESPEKFKFYRDNPQQATPDLLFGQLVHKIILQPESLLDEFAVSPDVDRRTKTGRDLFAEFVESSPGKTIVTAEQFSRASAMRDALMANESTRKLFDGEREKPYFWTDEDTGEECKCRCDCTTIVGGELPVIVDYKTAANARTDIFNNAIFKHGYHFQAAMYTEGVMTALGLPERPDFIIVAQEKTPPYAVNVIDVTPDVLLAGIDTFRELIGIYHACKETGYWYGYNGPFGELNETYLPGYIGLRTQDEEDDE